MPSPVRIDIRQLGGIIDPEQEDDAIRANPRVAYFPSVAPEGGYEYSRFSAVVVHVPYTVHRDYGGELLDEQIRDRVTHHMAAGEYPIIRWAGVIPEWISLLPGDPGCVVLTWYPENPSYTFNIYRSVYMDKGFELVVQVDPETYGNNSLTMCGLTSDVTYYFYMTAVSPEGIESPRSVIRGVRVL